MGKRKIASPCFLLNTLKVIALILLASFLGIYTQIPIAAQQPSLPKPGKSPDLNSSAKSTEGKVGAPTLPKAPPPPKPLVYILSSDASSLDPAIPTDTESFQVIYQIYETLFQFKPGSTEVQPFLCENYTVSQDGKLWSFRLRRGVIFQDGTPLNAEAVKFTFERMFDEAHPFHVAGKMSYAALISGNNIKSIETAGENVVVFTLKYPYVAFQRNLAIPAASIISPTALKKWGKDFSIHPCGTGPYRLDSPDDWKRGQEITLRANPAYWGDPPRSPRLHFKVIKDPNIRYDSIKRGDAHIMIGLLPSQVAEVKSNPQLTITEMPGLALSYVMLNNRLSDPPLNNTKVRQALNYAINKNYITETLLENLSIPANGVIPPGMLGYKNDRISYPYDPEKARNLLAEVGYPNGFKMELLTTDALRPYNPLGSRLAQALQDDLRKVGIDASIRILDFGALLEVFDDYQYQAGTTGWITDNGDPDNFIYALLGSQPNNTGYNNPQALQLMEEAQRIIDPLKRAVLYQKAEDIIVQDAPFIFLDFSKQIVLTRKNVRGFNIYPIGLYKLNQARLED